MELYRYGIMRFDDPYNDTTRKIVHIDMDAFFASIEVRDDPSLKHKPVIISKHPKDTNGKGIVATCNYVARQYGIHSAMSSKEAYERCPKAVFIPGRMSYYRAVSQEVREHFKAVTDLVEAVSVDEAYLDVTENKITEKSAIKVARIVQQNIWNDLKLTCSAGVSYNKFIAKLSSDYKKPAGLTVVTPENAHRFLMALPIEKYHGVGAKSAEKFKAMNVFTGKDLYNLSFETLVDVFGKQGSSLYFKVRGIDNRPVTPIRERKSIGKERTYGALLYDINSCYQEISQMVQQIAEELKSRHTFPKVLTLKIRYKDFTTKTFRMSLIAGSKTATELYMVAKQLLDDHCDTTMGVRLLGVSVSMTRTLPKRSEPLL